MLGDDTRAALNGAPCAVAIASRATRHHPAITRIGVAYDGSPESVAALAAARDLAGATGEPSSLCGSSRFAVALRRHDGAVRWRHRRDVKATAEMKELAGVEGRAEYGLAGEELAAFSGEVDLLIVGSRNYGPARRLVGGSTSNHLQRHARGPLLILPRGDRPGLRRPRAPARARLSPRRRAQAGPCR